MKTIKVYTGLLAGGTVPYKGEHIFTVKGTRVSKGVNYYCLEHDVWLRELGPEKYVTEWTNEEVWGRTVEVETGEDGQITGSKELGFILLKVDRKNGVLFDILFRESNLTESMFTENVIEKSPQTSKYKKIKVEVMEE